MWRSLQRERYGGGANCDAEKREKKGGKFLHEVIIDCLRPEAFDSWGRSGVARFAAPFFSEGRRMSEAERSHVECISYTVF